jgi:1-acyl-sn-glycerol-3-phosphate acyltransferase
MPIRLIRRDALGNFLLFKRFMFIVFGMIANYRFRFLNITRITGSENIKMLPKRQVLIVSNHQTYFADVTLMLLTFFSIKNGHTDRLGNFLSLLNPAFRVYFVAAVETMKTGMLPKLFGYVGGILVKRTWREKGKEINREVDLNDTAQIGEALHDGWVITFPQGTTKPFAPGRKGTAHIIKQYKPIVLPIVIDGFRRAFDKKGMFIKKKGVEITMRIKPALDINYDDEPEEILAQIMEAIEQSEAYHPKNWKGEEEDEEELSDAQKKRS